MVEEVSPPTKTTHDWDGVTALIAALIGLLALCVSAYTAHLQRQQVRAQVWPLLLPGSSNAQHELVVLNKGMGPAIVGSLKVFVDGKPQRNWDAVFRSLGVMFEEQPQYSTVNGIVISPGERIVRLSFANAQDYNRFAAQAHRTHMQLCYCSTLDECWMVDDSRRDMTSGLSEVEACQAGGPEQFHDNENYASAPQEEGK